jgi:phosphate transport system substrate-binding protein
MTRSFSTAGAAALLCALLLTGPSAQAASTLRLGGDLGSGLLVESIASSFNAKFHGSVTAGAYAATSSSAAISAVASGSLDLGVSSRDPLSTDAHGLTFTPFAKQSIAIVVNPKNPICKKGLSLQQVVALFTGQVSTWDAVGAPGTLGIILPYVRVGTSGVAAMFSRLFLNGGPATGDQLYSDGAIRAQVALEPGGIGIVSGAYAAASKAVCGVSIDGVAPTAANTASGRYRYWSYEYLVTKGAPAGNASSFAAFARSAAVQQAVVSRLAVPITATVRSLTT